MINQAELVQVGSVPFTLHHFLESTQFTCLPVHYLYHWHCHWYCRVQPTVMFLTGDTFPIGDHDNILQDYEKMGPSKILKLLTCRCHYLTDMLNEFSQSRTSNLFKMH